MLSKIQFQEIIFKLAFPKGKVVCPYCSNTLQSERNKDGYFHCRICRRGYRNGDKSKRYRFNEWTDTPLKGCRLKPERLIELIYGFLANKPPKKFIEDSGIGKNTVYSNFKKFGDALVEAAPKEEQGHLKNKKVLVFGVSDYGKEVSITPLPDLKPAQARKIVKRYNWNHNVGEFEKYTGFIIGKSDECLHFIADKYRNPTREQYEKNKKSKLNQIKGGGGFFQFYQSSFVYNYVIGYMKFEQLGRYLKKVEYLYNQKIQNPEESEIVKNFLKLVFRKNGAK